MTQEPHKSNIALIIIAIIGVIGTVIGATITVIGNYNVEKLRQETELTRIALVLIATQGGATQASMASTISAPTSTPYPTNELQPTYTPYPTYTPVPFPTIPPTASVSLPFEDTFDLRAKPEWQPTGAWRVVDGHYIGDKENDNLQTTFIGGENWQNYRIDVTSYSDDFLYPVQIMVRANNNGYLAFRVTNWYIEWVLVNSGNEVVIVDKQVQQPERYKATYKISVDVNNDIFSGFVNGVQLLQIQDSTFPRGRVGLGYESPYLVWFDNFSITDNH